MQRVQVWGLESDRRIFPSGTQNQIGERGNLTMKSKPNTTQTLARQAFGILLELRERRDAHQRLSKALAFLEVLAREKEVGSAPIVLSIRLMQLRKL